MIAGVVKRVFAMASGPSSAKNCQWLGSKGRCRGNQGSRRNYKFEYKVIWLSIDFLNGINWTIALVISLKHDPNHDIFSQNPKNPLVASGRKAKSSGRSKSTRSMSDFANAICRS